MSSISQEQPVMAYPNTFPIQQQQQQQPNPTTHSNGSFGSVFIVLAVIIVISAVACFLGRLCSKSSHKQKPKASHKQTQPQSQSKIQPESQKCRIRPKEEDIELGFDFGKVRSAKGGNMGSGFDKKRSGSQAGIEFGFDDKKRNQREGGIEFGFDKRAPPSGRPGNGVKLSGNGGVNKFGGDPRAGVFGPQ